MWAKAKEYSGKTFWESPGCCLGDAGMETQIKRTEWITGTMPNYL